MAKFLTITYTIDNEESFKDELERIRELFAEDNNRGWAVTAFSFDHEITRAELYKELFERFDKHGLENASSIADKIYDHTCIGDVKSIDELVNT